MIESLTRNPLSPVLVIEDENDVEPLAGPCAPPGLCVCPAGGVNVDTMNEYLSLPEVFVVGGSRIVSKRQITEKQWSVITQQTRDALGRAGEVAQ